jgi:hypothetical protein
MIRNPRLAPPRLGRPVRLSSLQASGLSFAVAVATIAVAFCPAIERRLAERRLGSAVDGMSARWSAMGPPPRCPGPIGTALALPALDRPGATLASWQSVGGCGVGASNGAGAGGVRWVGRSVNGGLFDVQCQSNYLSRKDGYDLSLSTQVTRDIGRKWRFGVLTPYIYRFLRDPYGLGFDVSNKGPGDVNVLLTRKLGPINATSATLFLGLPTGAAGARVKNQLLVQDKQLGLGKPTGTLSMEHNIDELWGLVVFGGALSYRGGENEFRNARPPSAAVYGYSGYLVGPFVPALGMSLSGQAARDRNVGTDQATPLLNVSFNGSVEWSNEWVAVLAGFSVPYELKSFHSQPWSFSLGVSVSPF